MIERFEGQFKFLSNFYPCTVMLDGEEFPSIEHAYQAAKTLVAAQRAQVSKCFSPGEAKKLGRTLLLRDDWEDVKLAIMEALLREKFVDPTLEKQLLDTGEQELVEGNWWGDTYWGVCRGSGENHLGKLLMKIRAEKQRKIGREALHSVANRRSAG